MNLMDLSKISNHDSINYKAPAALAVVQSDSTSQIFDSKLSQESSKKPLTKVDFIKKKSKNANKSFK